MDLIDRQQALKIKVSDGYNNDNILYVPLRDVIKHLKDLPSAEPKIIRCEDCKWWDQKYDGFPMGYCMAAKHKYYSPHWEINIQRTYGKNFFCADAEPKEGEEE